MRDLEETIAFDMQYCQHYDLAGLTMIGGQKPCGHCKAGVNYIEKFGPEHGIFLRIPCTSGGKKSEEQQLTSCAKWMRRTREQGEERHRAMTDAMAKFEKVMPVVAEWRKRQPKGKFEVIECPACGGRLHLSQAASNGHVHGSCETKGCVSWME